MQAAPTRGVEVSHTTQTWLRILIASYFIAVALKLIPGTNFSSLFALIADTNTANLLTSVTVFTLAYLVMIGCYLRVAALLLGLMTFFAAFIVYIDTSGAPGAADLGAFWRDIALVSALMLTYVSRRRKTGGLSPAPAPARPITMTNLASRHLRMASVGRPSDLRAPLGDGEVENIFLDYTQAR